MLPKFSPTTTLARQIRAGLNRARFSSLAQRGGQVGGGSFLLVAGAVFHGSSLFFLPAAEMATDGKSTFRLFPEV